MDEQEKVCMVVILICIVLSFFKGVGSIGRRRKESMSARSVFWALVVGSVKGGDGWGVDAFFPGPRRESWAESIRDGHLVKSGLIFKVMNMACIWYHVSLSDCDCDCDCVGWVGCTLHVAWLVRICRCRWGVVGVMVVWVSGWYGMRWYGMRWDGMTLICL